MEANIGDFLRSRRARIDPEQIGLPSYGRRRVPGLRREELAQLAGVSVDYYVRLEQGRSPNVSTGVLDAVARTLRLDRAEREHLANLVRVPSRNGQGAESDGIRPGLQRLIDEMSNVPAFILGRRMDILAWNALGDAVSGFTDLSPDDRNAARHAFLHPAAREFYPQWEQVAAETVAYLRLDAGRHPGDPRLAALIGELSGDETFRRLWDQQEVKEKTHGQKWIEHPIVGALRFEYETLTLPGQPDQVLVTYTPADLPTEHRLRTLAGRNDDQTSIDDLPSTPVPGTGPGAVQ